MERWTSRVALVTGASRGIGAAICTALVKHGINVVGCARNKQKMEELARKKDVLESPGQLHPFVCDVAQESNISALFDEIRRKYGRIDICINNAGIMLSAPLSSGKASDWKQVMEVNVLGTWACTREALKLMREKSIEDGVIIQMGSIVGHKIPSVPRGSPDPGFAVYNGTKFMNRALAEALRQELKSHDSRIRVSMVSPGAVVTDMLGSALGSEAVAALFKSVKCLEPEDIADAVVYVLKAPSHENVDDVIVQPVEFRI